MKKLTTLLVMLLFTAGMAFGQNNATVDQNDDGNEAFIDQVGDLNTANVEQTSDVGLSEGEGHFADIDQLGLGGLGSGVNNLATVKQDFRVTGAHATTIEQWGDDNVAHVEQVDAGNNVANILQDGIENFANVYQQYWNEFDATQIGDDNKIIGVPGGGTYGFGGRAFQIADGFSSLRYEMDFTQDGDNNTIQAGQERGYGSSTILQTGDWNAALSYQNGGSGDMIDIAQTGHENDAVVNQIN
ncbi:MAG: curlin repeat-containing protein [Balneolaceae bacterium]|nr:curlin repeat-containing protein [Balneolaceae bacterium]